jgi:hypothetical protein
MTVSNMYDLPDTTVSPATPPTPPPPYNVCAYDVENNLLQFSFTANQNFVTTLVTGCNNPCASYLQPVPTSTWFGYTFWYYYTVVFDATTKTLTIGAPFANTNVKYLQNATDTNFTVQLSGQSAVILPPSVQSAIASAVDAKSFLPYVPGSNNDPPLQFSAPGTGTDTTLWFSTDFPDPANVVDGLKCLNMSTSSTLPGAVPEEAAIQYFYFSVNSPTVVSEMTAVRGWQFVSKPRIPTTSIGLQSNLNESYTSIFTYNDPYFPLQLSRGFNAQTVTIGNSNAKIAPVFIRPGAKMSFQLFRNDKPPPSNLPTFSMVPITTSSNLTFPKTFPSLPADVSSTTVTGFPLSFYLPCNNFQVTTAAAFDSTTSVKCTIDAEFPIGSVQPQYPISTLLAVWNNLTVNIEVYFTSTLNVSGTLTPQAWNVINPNMMGSFPSGSSFYIRLADGSMTTDVITLPAAPATLTYPNGLTLNPINNPSTKSGWIYTVSSTEPFGATSIFTGSGVLAADMLGLTIVNLNNFEVIVNGTPNVAIPAQPTYCLAGPIPATPPAVGQGIKPCLQNCPSDSVPAYQGLFPSGNTLSISLPNHSTSSLNNVTNAPSLSSPWFYLIPTAVLAPPPSLTLPITANLHPPLTLYILDQATYVSFVGTSATTVTVTWKPANNMGVFPSQKVLPSNGTPIVFPSYDGKDTFDIQVGAGAVTTCTAEQLFTPAFAGLGNAFAQVIASSQPVVSPNPPGPPTIVTWSLQEQMSLQVYIDTTGQDCAPATSSGTVTINGQTTTITAGAAQPQTISFYGTSADVVAFTFNGASGQATYSTIFKSTLTNIANVPFAETMGTNPLIVKLFCTSPAADGPGKEPGPADGPGQGPGPISPGPAVPPSKGPSEGPAAPIVKRRDKGKIIGIAVGSAVALLIIVACLVYFLRKKKK